MDNENILVSDASEIERAGFYKKTYQHLALAVLAFIVVETILINIVPAEAIAWMFGGSYRWLLIIGLFWLGTTMSDRLSFHPSRQKQYLGLGLYVILEAVIFLPMIYIAAFIQAVEIF